MPRRTMQRQPTRPDANNEGSGNNTLNKDLNLMVKAIELNLEARRQAKAAITSYATKQGYIRPKMSTRNFSAIINETYSWKRINRELETNMSTDENEGETPVYNPSTNMTQDEGETPRKFRRRDMNPFMDLRPPNSDRKARRALRRSWFNEMRKIIAKEGSASGQINIAQLVKDDVSSRDRKFYHERPCSMYNSFRGCRSKTCRNDHICAICFHTFSTIKLHPYGRQCPIHQYRKANY